MAPAPDSERTFISLIFRSAQKYASWDPEVPVRVGDYGRITKGRSSKGGIFARIAQIFGLSFLFNKQKTFGRFLKEGNIYDEGIAEQFDIPAPVEYGAEDGEEERSKLRKGEGGSMDDGQVLDRARNQVLQGDPIAGGVTWITSRGVREVSEGVHLSADAAVATCKVKAAFSVTSNRGAVLAMTNDTISIIDPPGRLRRLLLSDKLKELDSEYSDSSVQNNKAKRANYKSKIVVVSEVHKCTSYARYLTTEGSRTFSIGLCADTPVSIGGGGAETSWKISTTIGNFKAKAERRARSGKTVEFYPLFRLVALEEGPVTSGMRGELADDEALPEMQPPWDMDADDEN